MIMVYVILEKLFCSTYYGEQIWNYFKKEEDFKGMYYLVELIPGSKETRKFVPPRYPYNYTWKTPTGANNAALSWTSRTGKKIQVRKVSGDPNWRRREESRFEYGVYMKLPGFWPVAPDTYPHFSKMKFDMIAHTESPEKGEHDIQTRIAPGRYLQKYFPNLGSEKIKQLVLDLNAEVEKRNSYELKFARTADEIEHVYINGPSSCMSKPVHYYSGDVHPVRAYGGGDLSIAYITKGSMDIVARVVVWEAKKAVGRVYGEEKDRRILEKLLEEAGYVDWDCNFRGAKLKAIPNKKNSYSTGYCFPYIDYIERAELKDDWIILGEGNICCQTDCGVVNLAEHLCSCCDEDMFEDDLYVFHDTGDRVCSHCADNEGFYCEGSDRYYSNNVEQYEVYICGRPYRQTRYWSEDYFERHGFECARWETYWANDYAVEMENGEVWCVDAFQEEGFECAATGKCYPQDEGVKRKGLWYHKDHDPKKATKEVDLEYEKEV